MVKKLRNICIQNVPSENEKPRSGSKLTDDPRLHLARISFTDFLNLVLRSLISSRVACDGLQLELQSIMAWEPVDVPPCHDGAEVSVSGLQIGKSSVQISPKTNFSIMIKLPVKSIEK